MPGSQADTEWGRQVFSEDGNLFYAIIHTPYAGTSGGEESHIALTNAPKRGAAANWRTFHNDKAGALQMLDKAGYEAVGVFKETGSGAKLDRVERRKVMALAQGTLGEGAQIALLAAWRRSQP